MNKLHVILAFCSGSAAGAVVAWQVLKKRYERITREEIESVKQVYSKQKYSGPQQSDETIIEKDEDEIVEDPELKKSYNEALDKYASTTVTNKVEDDSVYEEKPYVIMPEEYGELNNYDTAELVYYADGVLVDDCDDPVEDVEHTVGKDSLNHFGEYEDDSVHVRNDRLKCDYEILRDHRKYADVVKRKLPDMED